MASNDYKIHFKIIIPQIRFIWGIILLKKLLKSY